ncbi:hypothetical protein SLEP1_g23450 [Rubroshorea leprosula]|uniref:Uncharacterized protein n=1 Tax=Rubroshorea leprosula TaxID=152421 RepID=A0AAV5JFG7_9ROSI|nr:hypothetical protein SLEP1_g23450 [Rubroshorea leprosula]
MQASMDMPSGIVSCNSTNAMREMNDIISYVGNVELYVHHDINIPEIIEGPLLLTRAVSNDKEVLDAHDEGDNSDSDVSLHEDTRSSDSVWSLGSDKTDDEQVSIVELAKEVRKKRRNAKRSRRNKSKATATDLHNAIGNKQQDDHVDELVVP